MEEIRDSGREIIMIIRINNNVNKNNKRAKERKDERTKKMNK